MFQCALGRLVPRLFPPSPSLDLHVFVDAGGQPARHRVWGGLAAASETAHCWIETAVQDLRVAHPNLVSENREVKGKYLGREVAVQVGQRLRADDPGLLFWTNWYPRSDGEAMHRTQEMIGTFLTHRRVGRTRLDRERVEACFDRSRDYYHRRLTSAVNRHKVVSMLAHLTWLTTRLGAWQLGELLRSVTIVIDNENLPSAPEAGYFIKAFSAALLQNAGMAIRWTGPALFEEANVGAIRVRPDADSSQEPGLQLVDVLLPAVQQRLPDYGRASDDS